MVGNVHIIGQIGNSYDENGKITVKGVELIDIVSQVEPLIGYEKINVWINSGGGYVSVGNDIANYLSKIPNVVTIADGFCASIATKIHLAVPVENRKVVAGTSYMIHNPLIPQIENANVNDLKDVIDGLQPIQNELVKTYTDATGTSKEAIQSLMNVEASLTDEQLVSLGFVSEIINKVELKAVAFVDSEFVKKQKSNMNKSNIKLGLFAKAMAKIQGREVKAIMQEVEQGTIETPFSDLMVGDPIMLNGESAPEGEYTLEDGTKLVVVEAGIISEIVEPSGESVEYTELQAEIVDLKAQIESLKAEITSKDEAILAMETEHESILEVMNEMKAKASTYTPPKAQFQGRKPVTVDPAVAMAEKRAKLKK